MSTETKYISTLTNKVHNVTETYTIKDVEARQLIAALLTATTNLNATCSSILTQIQNGIADARSITGIEKTTEVDSTTGDPKYKVTYSEGDPSYITIPKGDSGKVWIPSVATDGTLSWTLLDTIPESITSVNLKGADAVLPTFSINTEGHLLAGTADLGKVKGDKGDDGDLDSSNKIVTTMPSNPTSGQQVIWIGTEGEYTFGQTYVAAYGVAYLDSKAHYIKDCGNTDLFSGVSYEFPLNITYSTLDNVWCINTTDPLNSEQLGIIIGTTTPDTSKPITILEFGNNLKFYPKFKLN